MIHIWHALQIIWGALIVTGLITMAVHHRGPGHTRSVTVQHHSTVFHVVLTLATGGLWLIPWLLVYRRHTVITTRRR